MKDAEVVYDVFSLGDCTSIRMNYDKKAREGGAYSVDEEAGHDRVPLAVVFIVFAWGTIDLLEIAWSSRSVPCSENSNVTGTCNHGEVRSSREVRWQHIRYCNLAKQRAGFWDIGKRVNVGMEHVLVERVGPVVLAGERKSRAERDWEALVKNEGGREEHEQREFVPLTGESWLQRC